MIKLYYVIQSMNASRVDDYAPNNHHSMRYRTSPHFTGKVLHDDNSVSDNVHRGRDPPPPPDSFGIDLAFEESKRLDANVGSNAKKVGKYMGRLQQYLEVISHVICALIYNFP